MPGKKIGDLDVYDDVNTDKSRRDLLEISKNTGSYASPTYATNGSRRITIEQLKETLFIKDITSYNQVTTGSPTFDKQAYNGIANAGTYTLPTSVGNFEVLAIILEAEINVTVNGLGTGISDLVFTKQNETAYLIDTTYGWYPLAVNKEVNSSAFELLANKENTTLDTSSTKYPTNNLVKTYVDNLGNTLTSGLDTKLTKTNNLSDLTNTSQARDNLLLGATNDVTHNSITLNNTTVSTLPFIDYAKKLITATGALLGTWFQTLTAKSTPVDADTIVVNDSASSFEAKITTLTELWTNYIKPLFLSGGTLTGALNYAPSVTLASASTVNIGAANSNNIIITGTTTINTFDTVTEGITKVLKFTGSLILQVPNLPNNNIIVTQTGDYCTVRSNGATWDFINYQRKNELITKNFTGNVTYTEDPVNIGGNIQKQSVALVAPFDNNFQRPIFVTRKNATTSGRTIMRFMGTQTNDVNGIWIQHNDMARTPNGSFNIMNCESSSSSVLIGVGADVNSATQTLQVFQGGVAISSSVFGSSATINASAQLDLQATNKGFLPNRMTNAQRTAISSPAIGLMVYCTDATEGLYIYKSTGWTFII